MKRLRGLSALTLLSLWACGCQQTPAATAEPSPVASVAAAPPATPGQAIAPVASATPSGPMQPSGPQSQQPPDFHSCALAGDLQLVQAVLQAQVPVDIPDPEGRTALMLASFNGHAEVVALLLEHGASVKAVDPMKRTSLMFAATASSAETVKLLLKAGSEINAREGQEKWTALMFAAGEGQMEICQILLEAGADASIKDTEGDQAVDHARTNKHQDVVKLLSK